jgi:formamidopyrimidine-DNA glycosylase
MINRGEGLPMPELAEVEYLARQMQSEVVGATIDHVVVAWPRVVSDPSPDVFCATIAGRRIASIDRRGKLLLVRLSGELILTVHRRMAGNLRLLQIEESDVPYGLATFFLQDGRRMIYSDPRKFGRMALVPQDALEAVLARYGIEPLVPEFTPAALGNLLHRHDRVLKAALLDQSLVAGLGNIYVDEALFAAQLHPLRKSGTLSPEEIQRLHGAIQDVLRTGIRHGGTTFGRHQGLHGEAGRNVAHLKVYQREGEACPRCGNTLQRIVVAQRGTRFCPTCQRSPEIVIKEPHP